MKIKCWSIWEHVAFQRMWLLMLLKLFNRGIWQKCKEFGIVILGFADKAMQLLYLGIKKYIISMNVLGSPYFKLLVWLDTFVWRILGNWIILLLLTETKILTSNLLTFAVTTSFFNCKLACNSLLLTVTLQVQLSTHEIIFHHRHILN